MDMGRRRTTSEGLPDGLTFDTRIGQYRYRNRETGKRSWVGADLERAVDMARKANLVLEARRQAAQRSPTPTIAHGVELYLENVACRKPWSPGTRKNNELRLAVIRRELGARMIATTDRVFLEDWLDARCSSGELFNKWRTTLVDLWRYWIARRWVAFNEAEAVMARSTSKKLPENRRKRARLDLKGFWAIHDHPSAELFLRVAMEQSLITLQSRAEVCRIRMNDDYRDGWLYIIRGKVAGETDEAFIRIRITPQLEEIRRLAMSDGIASPLLVRRRPKGGWTKKRKTKAHWSEVDPAYLSKAFAAVRDATGLWDGVPPAQRPSFHEIRSLGAREYKRRGYAKAAISALMTHSEESTTDIYLSGGQIEDERFIQVEAGLTLSQLRNKDA